MPRHVAILHGWSDNSNSFKPLAGFLKKNGYKTIPLFLGDYISLRDDVTIDDVAKRMEEVIRDKMALAPGKRGRLGKSFDLIVHSTGGLVARRWISMHYAERTCPVRNLLMLAPANFGSKLAHQGRSLLGRLYKGLKTNFETGEEMLHALELGSPFQWDLAQSDLFVAEGHSAAKTPVFYGPDAVRPFVIVGTHPYTELFARITNEDGSDGTVRVAAANLNSYGRTVDFSGDPRNLLQPVVTEWKKRGGKSNLFPLAVLPDRSHGSVVHPEQPGFSRVPAIQDRLGKLILQALRVNNSQRYTGVRKEWKAISGETRTYAGDGDGAQKHRETTFTKRKTPREYFHEYFQIFVRAEDEFGMAIPDYFLSMIPKPKRGFFGLGSPMSGPSAFFHAETLEDVHTNRRSQTNRCFFIDRYDLMRDGGFYDQIKAGQAKELHFTITAADPGNRIAYFSRSFSAKRGIVPLHQRATPGQRWLKRHSTHFIRIVVPRAADPGIFNLKRG